MLTPFDKARTRIGHIWLKWLLVLIHVLCIVTVTSRSDSHATEGTDSLSSTIAPDDSLSLEFGEVTLNWVPTAPRDLARAMEQVARERFTGEAGGPSLMAGVDRMLAALGDEGYREARISPSHFSVAEPRLSFTLTIESGPRTMVAAYQFAGLTRTDTSWLSQVLSLPTGVPLTSRWLDRARKRLLGLSNLRISAPPTVEPIEATGDGQTSAVVVIHLSEDAPSRFEGLVAAGNDGGESALTGRAALEFAGLFRRDRAAFLRYDRQRTDQTALTLRFVERGAFSKPLGWRLEFDELSHSHRRQTVEASVDYSFSSSRQWQLGLSGLWRKVTPGRAPVIPVRITELALEIGYGSGSQAHGNWTMPASTSLSFELAYSRRHDLGSEPDAGGATDRLRIRSEASARLAMAARWAVRLSSSAQWWPAIKTRPGPGDEWYLGGADKLRGYDELAFAASSGAWVSLEVERTLAGAMTTSLFGEATMLELMEGTAGGHRPLCYGWALGLASPQRQGRLEIAWRNGAPLRDGFLRLKVSQSW